ncbi:MAG: hypothetical protein H6622_11835 [Halobacteriovoraceae bacterium]|nr:hypothetical protein [Halobacteriovoraceae bacterium]
MNFFRKLVVTIKKYLYRAVSSLLIIYNSREDKRATLIESLNKLKNGLAKESKETKQMLEIYRKYTIGQASAEEMDFANEQFRDIIKSLGLGVFLFLPFAPITIPLIVTLGKKLGINVLPSGLKNMDTKEKPE